MTTLTLHVVRAWDPVRPDPRATDSLILACIEHLSQPGATDDRVLLIATEEGDRRAASLGLRTPYLIQPRGRFTGGTEKSLEAVLASFPNLSNIVLWSGAKAADLAATAKRAAGRHINVPIPDLTDLLPKRIPAGDRRSMRAELGISHDECVVALASDPPDAFAAQDFTRACALIALVGRNVTAIVPRQAPEMERAKMALRTTGVPVRLITSDAPVWTLLPACDAVVVDIQEGTHPRASTFFAQRWVAATAIRMGIPVTWTHPEEFPHTLANELLLRPQSRLPVHIARAFNEHFLQHKALSPTMQTLMPQSAIA